MTKRLYRNKQKASIGGVCAGLADYFNLDTTLIRALFLIALLGFGSGLLLYLILWIVMPERPYNYAEEIKVDYTVNEAGETIPAEENYPRKTNENVIGGLVMITIGIVFLADEFMPWFSFSKLWPLIIIAIGVGIIWNKNFKNK